MITKERLETLIREGATIYFINSDFVDCKDSKYHGVEVGNNYASILYGGHWHDIDYENLFETKEDAQWELEMTATRTETLKFPNYEDVFKQDRCLDCYTKEFAITKTDIVVGICLFGVDFTNKVVEVSVGADKMFIDELTKENYIEACKLCLELFGGDSL